MLAPTALLAALLMLLGASLWVTAILRDPSRLASAPTFMQQLTRSAYWRTRAHWPAVPDCAIFDPDLLYRPRPGRCTFQNPEFITTLNFDDIGARFTPNAHFQNDTQLRPRLLILGDSHAMGWGVNDHETFASILATKYGFSTVNLGVASYATPRELLRLQRDVPLRSNDIIIIQYCDNDYPENRHFALTGEIGPYDPSDFEVVRSYKSTPTKVLPIAALLLRRLWQDLLTHLHALPERRSSPDVSDHPTIAPTQALLNAMRAFPVLRTHRTVVVVINTPDITTNIAAGREAIESEGIELLIPTLRASEFMALDDHMTPDGHRAVAAAIASTLRARN